MTEKPVKISVIVPIYNVEKYIRPCLNSCVHQTLHDIEIICVNDGSTDNSLSIVKEYAKQDSRIIIVDKQNGGLSSARNAGLDIAQGETIMFLDSDDYLAPYACERVWVETLEAPTDIVIFGTEILPEVPRASSWYYNVLRVNSRRFDKFTPKVLFEQPGAKPFVWRQAFRKELLDEYNLRFDETVKFGEDMVFQMQCFPHAKNFSFIEDILYSYRWYREGSLMSSVRGNMDEKIQKHLSFVEIITEYWQKEGWLETYGVDYVNWILEFLIPDIRSKNTQNASQHIQDLNTHLHRFNLSPYMSRVPKSSRSLVHTLKKGK